MEENSRGKHTDDTLVGPGPAVGSYLETILTNKENLPNNEKL